ncbi:MAG: hypothetical protein GHCLOJNM_02307 [bacterium]|nr:hypothetical protein [bacterium]
MKYNLMALQAEPRRGKPSDPRGAPLDLKHAPAAPTVKMVVVLLPRGLVTQRLAGHLHGDHRALLEERLERAIDRGDAQTGFSRPSQIEDLARG